MWTVQQCAEFSQIVMNNSTFHATVTCLQGCPLVLCDLYFPQQQLMTVSGTSSGPVARVLCSLGKTMKSTHNGLDNPNIQIAQKFLAFTKITEQSKPTKSRLSHLTEHHIYALQMPVLSATTDDSDPNRAIPEQLSGGVASTDVCHEMKSSKMSCESVPHTERGQTTDRTSGCEITPESQKSGKKRKHENVCESVTSIDSQHGIRRDDCKTLSHSPDDSIKAILGIKCDTSSLGNPQSVCSELYSPGSSDVMFNQRPISVNTDGKDSSPHSLGLLQGLSYKIEDCSASHSITDFHTDENKSINGADLLHVTPDLVSPQKHLRKLGLPEKMPTACSSHKDYDEWMGGKTSFVVTSRKSSLSDLSTNSKIKLSNYPTFNEMHKDVKSMLPGKSDNGDELSRPDTPTLNEHFIQNLQHSCRGSSEDGEKQMNEGQVKSSFTVGEMTKS